MQKILEAGRWFPTAVHDRPRRILVLSKQENLAKVREFFHFSYDKKHAELEQERDDKAQGHNVYY